MIKGLTRGKEALIISNNPLTCRSNTKCQSKPKSKKGIFFRLFLGMIFLSSHFKSCELKRWDAMRDFVKPKVSALVTGYTSASGKMLNVPLVRSNCYPVLSVDVCLCDDCKGEKESILIASPFGSVWVCANNFNGFP